MSDFSTNTFKAIIEGGFPEQIHDLSPDTCSSEAARDRMQEWHEAGDYTVFTAGAYDILTPSHVLNLVQCRALGAMSLLGIDAVGNAEDQQSVHRLAASRDIRLMLTLDTN